jgi:arylformamidase
MSRALIDISPVVSSRIGVWPGDTPYVYKKNLSLEDGANIDLGEIHGTVHLGAHTDAPSHYGKSGETMEQRSLNRYYGTCEVIEVDVPGGERIRPAHLAQPPSSERVLFKTSSFPDPEQFNEDFVALSSELIEWLADLGVRFVGIDTPSVDLFADKVLESHQSLLRRDMAVLEGIVLTGVAPGTYTLIALPLKLEGADASPVRAALLPLD